MTVQQTIVLLSVIGWPAVALFALCAAIVAGVAFWCPRGTAARLRAGEAAVAANTAALVELRIRIDRLDAARSSEAQGTWRPGMGR